MHTYLLFKKKHDYILSKVTSQLPKWLYSGGFDVWCVVCVIFLYASQMFVLQMLLSSHIHMSTEWTDVSPSLLLLTSSFVIALPSIKYIPIYTRASPQPAIAQLRCRVIQDFKSPAWNVTWSPEPKLCVIRSCGLLIHSYATLKPDLSRNDLIATRGHYIFAF